MKGLENNAAELFRLMDRVRKAWQSVTPCEHLSKSQFGTLMAIAHHGRMPGQSCTPSQEHGALTLTALAGAMHQSLCCFSKRMRNFFRKNEKSVLQFCNKKPKRKGRLQRVEKSL